MMGPDGRAFIVAVLLALLVAGVIYGGAYMMFGRAEIPPRKCLRYETRMDLFPMWVGNNLIFMPTTTVVCTQWRKIDAGTGDRK